MAHYLICKYGYFLVSKLICSSRLLAPTCRVSCWCIKLYRYLLWPDWGPFGVIYHSFWCATDPRRRNTSGRRWKTAVFAREGSKSGLMDERDEKQRRITHSLYIFSYNRCCDDKWWTLDKAQYKWNRYKWLRRRWWPDGGDDRWYHAQTQGNNYLTVINRSGLPPIIGEDDDNPKDLYKEKGHLILIE